MKGIYLTEQGKQEIEATIAKLHKEWKGKVGYNMVLSNIDLLKEILSSATILPIEESWLKVAKKHGVSSILSEFYPNGVIIKQTKP